MKALFFGLLLILGGSAVTFSVPQVVVVWSGVTGLVGAASFALLIGSTCGLLVIVSGLVIGYWAMCKLIRHLSNTLIGWISVEEPELEGKRSK